MRQIFLVLSLILFSLFIVAGVYVFRSKAPLDGVPGTEVPKVVDGKVRIVASFYPIGEFARQVGGDAAVVSVIVPAGVEPHDYEPTPRDIASMYAADAVLLNGAGIDGWATKIRPELERKGVKVLVMSQVLGFDDGQDGVDPHFWLDPMLAIREVIAIADTLSAVDEGRFTVYTDNAKAYADDLSDLDRYFREGLSDCGKDTIVTSHDAFGYVAKAYGFEALSIAGISPESEPSTKQLAELSVLAREKRITHVFFETLVSPRLAEVLAKEIGAKTLIFDPLEGLSEDATDRGENYVSIMRENLENLRIALECH